MNQDEYKTIEGILMRVSEPRTFTNDAQGVAEDYVYLGLKTAGGDRVMVFLTMTALGWSGNFAKSKMWYYNSQKRREIKTAMRNADQYVGKKFRVTGFLEAIDLKERKFRMNRVQRIVVFPD
jgi:hypothetical protein